MPVYSIIYFRYFSLSPHSLPLMRITAPNASRRKRGSATNSTEQLDFSSPKLYASATRFVGWGREPALQPND